MHREQCHHNKGPVALLSVGAPSFSSEKKSQAHATLFSYPSPVLQFHLDWERLCRTAGAYVGNRVGVGAGRSFWCTADSPKYFS